MDHHIDFVFFQNAQVDLAQNRHGIPEHDVLKVRRDHRAAPAVGQRATGRRQQETLVILIDAHVGAMHQLHHLAVDAPRHDPQLPPDLLPFGRRPFYKRDLPVLAAELLERLFAHLDSDLLNGAVADLHIQIHRNLVELLLVLDLELGHFPFGGRQKSLGDAAGMVRMGRASGRDHPGKVAGGNRFGGRTAEPHPLLRRSLLFLRRRDAARAHRAVLAATSLRADGTGFHRLRPIEYGFATVNGGFLNHFDRRRIDTFLFQI